MKEYFSRSEISADLKNLITKINGRVANQDTKKASHIRDILKIIVTNTAQFDRLCQVNIAWIGEHFATTISSLLTKDLTSENLDYLYGDLFRFVTEFELSLKGEISMELRRFISYADDEPSAFSKRALDDVQFARHQMPIAILKQLVGSSVLQNVSNPQLIADAMEAKEAAWRKDLDTREQSANRLKEALTSYTTGFNFVGLHQGFDNMSEAKKAEVASLNRLLVFFGVFASAPLVAELIATSFYLDRFGEWNATMLVATIPAFSLTILLIYFFRIVLRRAEAARSQLLQIELRKTLCQFIQSYADYAKEIKGNNPEALAKFENMIFSGIVSTEDKLPTTFDGIDQLSQLVQSVRGTK